MLEAMQSRLDQAPEMMRIRRQTVEHPFGTLKSWMGATHFLTRTLDRVSTEMSLHVLAYNLKRVLRLMGSGSNEGLRPVLRLLPPSSTRAEAESAITTRITDCA
ncbi:Transposase DDE domain-containing protein [Pseudomonas linyingensis]|uniref:Transposase DDE domain-containing protein n=1 Tax=Pseudomonas linyingensis TaxID=915471 RepID=A0A1H7AN44_9PSED|nr:Transposase DDE domain-containing protein [Pseudomonas linyingensis]